MGHELTCRFHPGALVYEAARAAAACLGAHPRRLGGVTAASFHAAGQRLDPFQPMSEVGATIVFLETETGTRDP